VLVPLLLSTTLHAHAADPDAVTILPLDEGSGTVAGDVSGNGNDGTLMGGALFEANTADGSPFAVHFDGTDDYIDLGPLDVNGTGLTLACWFNPDAFPGPSNDPRLIAKATGTGANDHIFMLGTVLSPPFIRLRARVRVGGVTTTLVASSGDLTQAVWRHAAATYDGTTLRLYLDGVEVGSMPLSGAVDTDPTVPVAVGNQPPGAGDRFFDGLLDDVRILQRALSESEIAAIIGGNQAPVAVDDGYGTTEEVPLVVSAVNGVLANDTDPEQSPLQAVLSSDVTNGVLNLNADGSFDYTPDLNFFGIDSFTYWANDGSSNSNLATVTLTVNGVNDAPIAVDDGYQTEPNTPLMVDVVSGVLANDTDPDLDELKVVLLGDVANGALNLNADGSFDYTPDLNFTGADSFTYRAKDTFGDGKPFDDKPKEDFNPTGGFTGGADGTSPLSNVATVTITVDQPPLPPTAVDDSYSTGEDTTLVVAAVAGVLANDTDNSPPDDLTAVLLTMPSNGVLTNFASDGGFTYVPDPNANGVDSFTYEAVDGGSGATAQATVILTVNAVNDAPVAVNDNYQTQENTQLVVNAVNGVLKNDTDPEMDPLQAVLVGDVSDGTLNLNLDGSFDYTPDLDFTGVDSFTYQANDASLNSNVATVTITVSGGSDPDAIVILPLDEGSGTTAGDVSGNGNDGTLFGGAAFETNTGDGSFSAVRFDGSDDFIDLGALDVTGTGLTLACWFNADAFPGGSNDARLISKASGITASAHVFMLSTVLSEGAIRLRARVRVGGTTTTLIASSGSLAAGEWRHAAATYDGVTLRLYLDATEVGSTPLSGAVDMNPSIPVAVGSQPIGALSNFWDGLIDDVRILQRAMNLAELQAIVSAPRPPIVEVWYGDNQDFGHMGNPQTLIQIMGRVRETAPLTNVSYRLNGGGSQSVPLGPDGYRLVGPGDYNIEIDNTSLNAGANTVEITADDAAGETTVRTVTVNYTSGVVWALPSTLTWQGASSIADVAQVVDGSWILEGAGVRTVSSATGYDRLLVAGDYTWVPDYEAVMPITTHSIVSGGAVGIAVGWHGHTGPQNPKLGHPFQAIAWVLSTGNMQMLRNGDAVQAQTPVPFVLGTRYMLKVRSESIGGGQHNVKAKWWDAGGSEPGSWNLSENFTTMNGSVLLIAHMADATFEEVSITPIGASAMAEPPSATDDDLPPSIRALTVKQNFPNPFGLNTDIEYGLPVSSDVVIQVYDVRGRRVYEQHLADVPQGWNRFRFDGRGDSARQLAGGVYFYQITTPQGSVRKKMVIMR
jgi:VCBS repeat-containing protein